MRDHSQDVGIATNRWAEGLPLPPGVSTMQRPELDELFRADPGSIHEIIEYNGLLPRVADVDRRPAEVLRDDLAGVVRRNEQAPGRFRPGPSHQSL